MIELPWWLAAIITAIPTSITGLAFWLLQRDEARLKNEVMLIQKVDASLCLAEATARAVQRIPDAKCNGDMHDALGYAQKVKQEHRKFMTEQGVHQLYD